MRKLRCPSKTTPFCISILQKILCYQPTIGFVKYRIISLIIYRHPKSIGIINMGNQVLSLRFYLVSFLCKKLLKVHQEFFPTTSIVCFNGREISASIKRLFVRGQKHIQWPSTTSCNSLHRIHVYMIQIWPLLPVYFDVHKIFIHYFGSALILKTLPFHHVAPMARRIANTHQDWLVLRFCFLQCLLSPRVPIHGIVGVLQQVNTRFINQLIGMFMHVFHLFMRM